MTRKLAERLPGALDRLARRVTPDTPRAVTITVARARRGWAPSDTWSLDQHLCRILGEMLEHLADHTHGWPQSDEFPQFADWHTALQRTAEMLLRYEPDDPDAVTNAQGALEWVAEHLQSLWD